ncbi:antA/AntB antirepressor family protein [Leminorella grimontii]|uniref:antA/AntB antirepressor family protein n=1 Tax=Leminorella grimontii TaxID=82981 RepID=UPI00208CE98D|nr:antA/AntB antirepressor family protein [Leminorella grimontii]GKX60635.1 anti-repressor protein [Leminorella grimontii]
MATSKLIPVFSGSISNEKILLCNARELHAFLQVGKRFASWIKERISEYGFIENQDYIAISQKREIGYGRGKREYHLTLDTAKELAMVERNEQGRKIRRYFINCEKRLIAKMARDLSKPKASIDLQHLAALHRYLWDAHELLTLDIAPALRMLQSPLTGRLVGLVEAALVKEMMLQQRVARLV